MDGWWDCDAFDEMCCRAIAARARWSVLPGACQSARVCEFLPDESLNAATAPGSEVRYDLGNDFFQAMLDPWMQYSCAIFENGDDLATAQVRKLEIICQRFELRPGMRLLDIGCGWGGLAKYPAKNYACAILGLTASREQQQFAER